MLASWRNPVLNAYLYRPHLGMLDAQLARRFIATAFTSEIRIAIYPIILFGDRRLMDLSWLGSHEKTVTSPWNSRSVRLSIRSLMIWWLATSWVGWRALLSSALAHWATAASSRRLTRPKCATGSTGKSSTVRRSVLSLQSCLAAPQHSISIFHQAVSAWRVSCREYFRFGPPGGRDWRRSPTSMGRRECKCWSQQWRHAFMPCSRHTGNVRGYRCCSTHRSI